MRCSSRPSATVEEARLAVRAAQPTGLPIIVSFAFDSGKNKDRTMMGVTPETAARAMVEEGVDAIGANCGAGPESFAQICRRLKNASGLPVWIKPNAGMPTLEAGQAVYTMTADAFAGLSSRTQRGRGVVSGRLLRHEPRVRPRTGEGRGIMRILLIGCEVIIRELCDAVTRSPHVVDARFLSKGLHDLGARAMRAGLQAAIDEAEADAEKYDAIALGYGLCGNGLAGLEARSVPLVLPRAHDCITPLDGKSDRVRALFPGPSGRLLSLDRLGRARGRPRASGADPDRNGRTHSTT